MTKLTRNSLEQLLKVITEVKDRFESGDTINSARKNAVKRVSNDHGLSYQTVLDACWRRINLNNIDKFDQLLERWLKYGDSSGLLDKLYTHTQQKDHQIIKAFFNHDQVTVIPPDIPETITLSIKVKKETLKKLKLIAIYEDTPIENIVNNYLDSVIDEKLLEHMKKHISDLSDDKEY